MARLGRGPGSEDGFGLVEIMISLLVLMVVLVSTSYLVDSTIKDASINRQRVAAAELAEQYIETLSNSSLASLQGDVAKDVLLTTTPVTEGGVSYNVWSHLDWATTGTPTNLCSSGNPPEVIRATITVKWGTGIQAESLAETAVINPPYGTVVSGDGFLSVQIVGANSNNPPADTADLTNVQVTVTNTTLGTNATYNPDQYGCVYLQEPIGDTYNVAMSSPSGGPTFIDWGDLTTNPTTVSSSTLPVTTVTGGGKTIAAQGIAYSTPKFHYDEAGTVTLSPQAGSPIASGMPIMVQIQSQLSPTIIVPPAVPGSGASTYLGMNAANATSALLFPTYTTPYSIWYGDCNTVSSTNVEEPSSPTSFTVAEGATQSATITGLDTLALNVTSPSSNLAATATVADPNSATDGCSTAQGEQYTLTGFSGSGTSFSDSTQIIGQTYHVVVTDKSDNKTSATETIVVGSSGVTMNGTACASACSITVQ